MALVANNRAKITLDICKLNVNMSVATPVAKWLLNKSRRRTMHVGKKIRPSRLKALILYKRMMKKEANWNAQQRIQQVTLIPESKDDISALNFEGLRIDVVPPVDTELATKMSALTYFGSDYREPRTSEVEDNVVFRPDLQEQMENMFIDIGGDSRLSEDENNYLPNVCQVEFIDSDTMEATKNLKISEPSGESNSNVCIKEIKSGLKFTKKFREYCTNTVTRNLNSNLEAFLAEVSRLQKKMYEKDNVKGKNKRRYYAGIREVQKHIELKKMKFVVIAPDLEKVELEGGLDDAINKLIATCKRYEVPCCFGLSRRKLGYYIHGKGFVNCIGIANYSGAEDKLLKLLREVIEARNNYLQLASREPKTIDVDKLLPREELLLSELINAYLKIIASTS